MQRGWVAYVDTMRKFRCGFPTILMLVSLWSREFRYYTLLADSKNNFLSHLISNENFSNFLFVLHPPLRNVGFFYLIKKIVCLLREEIKLV